MKNVAGFNRGFRFSGQKHICVALKEKAPREYKH